jgi:uncharacterized protein (TIRG00374 family)
VGIAAFFVYIYIFNVDLLEIIEKVQQADVHVYLSAAILSFLDILFFTLAWFALLRFLSVKISLVKAHLFVWISIFIDIIIPAESVSGEITKIYLVNKEQNGTTGKTTASIVAQRIISMGINIITLTVGAILLIIEHLFYGMILTLTLILIIMTIIFLVLILLLSIKEAWTLKIVNSIINFVERISRGRWKLAKLKEQVVEATSMFHGAIREFARAPKTMFIAAFLSLVSWVCGLTVYYLTLLSVGYSPIRWSAILVIASIFVAIKSIPTGVPFEVGLPEIALSTLLIFFGVPPLIAATATILMRLLTLWLRFFIGFVAQQLIGIKAVTTVTSEEPTFT